MLCCNCTAYCRRDVTPVTSSTVADGSLRNPQYTVMHRNVRDLISFLQQTAIQIMTLTCVAFTSLTYFGLLRPCFLFTRSEKLIVSCPRPVDHLCQFSAKSVHDRFQIIVFIYLVTNDHTDGQMVGWTSKKHYACGQTRLADAQKTESLR